jgi:hypothetical protein
LLLFSEVSDYATAESKNYFKTIDSLKFQNSFKSKNLLIIILYLLEIMTIDMDISVLEIERDSQVRQKDLNRKVKLIFYILN